MKALTTEEEVEVSKLLKRRYKGYSTKAIKGIVDTINHLRAGTMKITDFLVPHISTYQDFLLDTGLHKYVEPIKIEENEYQNGT